MLTEMFGPETVYELMRQAASAYKNETAIRYIKTVEPKFIDEMISYEVFFSSIKRAARVLRERISGAEKQRGVVSFLLPSIPQTHSLLWGAESVAIANPLNPLLSEDALVALMDKAGTDVLVALGPNPASDIWEKAEAVAGRLAKKPKLLSVAFKADDYECFDDLVLKASNDDLPGEWLPAADDIAAYFHTGGTTGTPKLAMQSHRNQLCTAALYKRSMKAGVGDVCVNGLPMFHVAGALVLALGGAGVGVQMVLPTMAGFRNPDVIKHYWTMVERYQVTIGGGIPTSVAAMLATPIAGSDISSLRYMIAGGAPTPLSVAEQVQRIVGCGLYQIYGMTETAGALSMPNLERPPPKGSAGHIFTGIDVRVDTASKEPQAIGEICVRGDMIFQGYLGDEQSPLDDGWLRTGDLGYVDSNNDLYITGRAKDLIIRSGHNIDPAIIEACLERHPAVTMAAAVGKPDSYAGELPVAFVQLNEEHAITEDELRDYTLAHIDERPACPKAVFIVDALPVTAVGKIHKPTLRAKLIELIVKEALVNYDVEINSAVHDKKGIQTTVILNGGDESVPREMCAQLHAELGLVMAFSLSGPDPESRGSAR